MALGPVQLLVVGLERPDAGGAVLAELERLRAGDVVRLVDVLVVAKDTDGVVERLDHAGLADGAGAVVGALIGLGAADGDATDGQVAGDEEFWSLDEAIPAGSAAAIALVEHRWAIGTRDAIRAAGGVPVADAWIHPADLAAAGLVAAGGAAAPDA
jgi:uncharacterized membrane protein